jgi:hypothetical protein
MVSGGMYEADFAWAAGFFDAEGCFANAGTPMATASQVQLEPLDVFVNTVGIGTLNGPYEKATSAIKRRPQWVYYTYGQRATSLFDMLEPWFGRYRREQGHRALQRPGSAAAPRTFDDWPWVEQVAWCGGFWEGEGTFSRAGRALTARLANTELELVERVHRTLGTGHIYGPYTKGGRTPRKKPQWVYTTSGFEEMQAILAILWPWLSSRRRLTAMALLENHLTFFYGCGHRRDRARWRKHCPRCFKPGPKPGMKRTKPLHIEGQVPLELLSLGATCR